MLIQKYTKVDYADNATTGCEKAVGLSVNMKTLCSFFPHQHIGESMSKKYTWYGEKQLTYIALCSPHAASATHSAIATHPSIGGKPPCESHRYRCCL